MEHSDHPFPQIKDAKWRVFLFARLQHWFWGGRGVSVPCYSVRDCRCIKELANCKMLSKLVISVLLQLSMALQTTQGLERNRDNSRNNCTCTTILFFSEGTPESVPHSLNTPPPPPQALSPGLHPHIPMTFPRVPHHVFLGQHILSASKFNREQVSEAGHTVSLFFSNLLSPELQ